MDPASTCKLDLARLMRQHGITIRELAERTGITMTRIREVRAMTRVSYMIYCDYVQAVTGRDVFNRGRYDAMTRQISRS